MTIIDLHSSRGWRPADNGRVQGGTFHAWLSNRGYSPRTAQVYGQYVVRATSYFRSQGAKLNRAKHRQLYEWWSTLPLSSSSRNGARHALIAYFRYRGRDDGAPAHRLPRIPAPEMRPRPVAPITYDEIRASADRLGGMHRILGALLTDTGCRISEARGARWHQFELRGSEPVWWIEGKGSRRKGPKIRPVSVNEHLRACLLAWQAETRTVDWLFPSDRSATGYVARCTLARRLDEICAEAMVDRITPHVMRHTVATIGVEVTGDVQAVQKLLGHASLATTQVYAEVSTRRIRLVTDALMPPGDGPPAA